MDNASQLGSDIPTFAHAFSAGGYTTLLSGRAHFIGADQRHGFERRLIGDVTTAYVNRDWELAPILGDLIDTAGYFANSILKSGRGRTGYHAYDEAVTQATVDWLETEAGDAAHPFLLMVGFVSPHCPFVAPPEYYALYEGKVRMPATSAMPAERLHPELRALRALVDDTPLEARIRARTAYYGLCSFVDAQLATLLATLERTGLRERTLVLYTSDHGEQIGEHGLWWKSTFYEGSIGVPLLMSGPGVPQGVTTHAHVSLMDLGPTLLDLLGLPRLPAAEGRSFRCLLEGEAARWPNVVTAEGISSYAPPRAMRMVRSGAWKLNEYTHHKPELFNLDEDPEETLDRQDDPACAEVLQNLRIRAREEWDGAAIERRMVVREEEWKLIRAWLQRAKPAEPDPLWFTEPQKNWVDTGLDTE
jgi:choline-sulfatase